MTKKEQIDAIVKHLKFIGKIKSLADMSRQMGVHSSTLSAATNGDEKYLTKNLLCYRIGSTYADIFNADWLRTGEGEMLKPEPVNSQIMGDFHGLGVQAQGNARVQLPSHAMDTSELITENESLRAENEVLKNEIEWLRSMLKERLS